MNTVLSISPVEHDGMANVLINSDVLESAPALESAPTLQRANMTNPVRTITGIKQVTPSYPDLCVVSAEDQTQQSNNYQLYRIQARAYVARAISGSAVDLSAKSAKGAALPDKKREALIPLIPEAKAWKNASDEDILCDLVPVLLAQISMVVTGVKPIAKVSSELEKARKYVKGLSIETIAALRAEGVI